MTPNVGRGWPARAALVAAAAVPAACAGLSVNPFVGTQGAGHCNPGATRPFAMVQPGPDTGNGSWAYCAGYQHDDPTLDGFSQTHLNGTGQPEMADFLILPFCGGRTLRKALIDKASERASPGYYAVALADAGVRVEITSTERVALYRLAYRDEDAHLLVDLQHFLWQEAKYEKTCVRGGGATFGEDDRSMSGWHEEKAYWPQHTVWFHAEFSHPVVRKRLLPKDRDWERAPRYVLDFDVKPSERLLVKMALSYVSAEGARRNLAAEMPGWDFDGTCRASRRRWAEILSRVEAEGATDDARTLLKTSLYRLCCQPNLISDVGEKARYSTFSLWDTYRAAHPLYTLLVPERVEAFLDSFLDKAEKTGFLPIWEIYGKEGYDMLGAHSVPVILDAYRKGFRVDLARFFPHVRKTLTEENRPHARAHRRCQWDTYDRLGYLPCDLVPWHSVSRVLECAYDDWCAAEMARELGLADDEAFFRRRSGFWKNLFREGWVCPRLSDGTWERGYRPEWLRRPADYRPNGGCCDTCEGSGYQWSFHVLHDVEGLVGAMGGRSAFLEKLDFLFSHEPQWASDPVLRSQYPYRDASGLLGEYAHGNEPCHHVPYLYSLVGERKRTGALARRICETFYPNAPSGMCGNNDCGQLSAWYVFAALGFYPVNPASAEYVLGEPLFGAVTVELPGGRRLAVRRDAGARGVSLNGRPVVGPVVRHGDLVRGGELAFGEE